MNIVHEKSRSHMLVTSGILATITAILGLYQGFALGGAITTPFFEGIVGGLLPFGAGALSTFLFLLAYEVIGS